MLRIVYGQSQNWMVKTLSIGLLTSSIYLGSDLASAQTTPDDKSSSFTWEWQRNKNSQFIRWQEGLFPEILLELADRQIVLKRDITPGVPKSMVIPGSFYPLNEVRTTSDSLRKKAAKSGVKFFNLEGLPKGHPQSIGYEFQGLWLHGHSQRALLLRVNALKLFYDLFIPFSSEVDPSSIRIQDLQVESNEFKLRFSLVDKNGRSKDYGVSFYKGQVVWALEPEEYKSALELLRAQREQMGRIKQQLSEKVFGQDVVLEKLLKHILEAQTNGMAKPKVLVAMGPSGVGKSYSAALLAEMLYEDKKFVMEISGNEYNAGTHALDYMKLFGGAKGTSAGEDGALIKWLKTTKGKGVLIINEGDKMHPDVWKRMMEFLEKGRLTDSEGKELWGKEVVVIITSNRGAHRLFPSSVDSWTQEQIDQRLRTVTQDELKGYYLQKDGLNDNFVLPREIINRVDEFIAFGPLSHEAVIKIAKSAIIELSERFFKQYGVRISFDEELIKHLALTEFKASDDARSVRNQMKLIFSELADALIEHTRVDQGSTVQVRLSQDGQKFFASATVDGEVDKLQIPVKSALNLNPIHNPVQRQKLSELESKLKEVIYGQDKNLEQIVRALIAYEVSPVKERPFTLGLFGPSGTGKTEIGKTIAKTFYGPKSQAVVIPMGNVSHFSDFENIFGSSAKYQGGDIEREFEKALRENPQGGVIIFDEISNMGGQDLRMKEALFKKLYDIFEEGKWVSPRDSRVYDLKKYKFILTGNDGEKLFLGVSSPDLLVSTWEEYNRPDKVRALLREAQLPNAFVNRVNLLLLMKPLLPDEVELVGKKLFHQQMRQFVESNPGLQISYDEAFFKTLVRVFYSPDQGGRSVRKALDTGIFSLVGLALLKAGVDEARLAKTQVHLKLTDTASAKPYLVRGRPSRMVTLQAEIRLAGELQLIETIDLTQVAERQVLMPSKTAKITAYHEAGHAIANDPTLTGERVAFVTIRGGSTGELDYYGYARYEVLPSDGSSLDRQQVVARIARLWAGRKAQELAGFSADAGWSDDLKKIRKLASRYLTEWGLEREFIALPVDGEGKPLISGQTSERYLARMDELIREGEQLAEWRLKRSWPLVRSMVAHLLIHGEITGEQFQSLQQRFAQGGLKNAKPYAERRASKGRGVVRCEQVFVRAVGD